MSNPVILPSEIPNNQHNKNAALLYIGSYNSAGRPSIHALTLDLSQQQFSLVTQDSQTDNASFLLYQADRAQLFAVSEINLADGANSGWVAQYDLSHPAQPKLMQRQLSQGSDPCQLAWLKQHLLCANYSGGNFSQFNLTHQSELTNAQHTLQHHGSSVVADRQSQAHVHSCTPAPSGEYFVVADLGADEIVSYSIDATGTIAKKSSLKMPAGSGPRHSAFHPSGDTLYVANELNNSLSQVQFNQATGALTLLLSLPALAPSNQDHSYPAEVVVDQQGKFAYLSNRGDDSISCFNIAPETHHLTFSSSCSTGGKFPRHFALSPKQDYVVVANQQSNNITLLKRDPHSGGLTLTHAQFSIETPSCVCFIK